LADTLVRDAEGCDCQGREISGAVITDQRTSLALLYGLGGLQVLVGYIDLLVPGRSAEDPGTVSHQVAAELLLRSVWAVFQLPASFISRRRLDRRRLYLGQPYNRQARANRQDKLSLPCASGLESLPLDRAIDSLWTSGGSGLHDLHFLSRDNGIRRICNHRFIALEAGNNLNLVGRNRGQASPA